MHDGAYALFLGGVEGDGADARRFEPGGEFGYEGSAFWLTSPDNVFRGNVAANAAFAGIEHNPRPVGGQTFFQPIYPNFRGARYPHTSADWTHFDRQRPVRQETGNTVY